MELWIRSQENYEADITPRLIKVNNLALDYVGENDSYYIVVNEGIEIAYYHSEEKALEALDEIQNILSGSCLLKSYDNATPEFSENIIINPCEVHIEQLNNYVYNMPKD